jgi:hypothetical protein
MEQMDNVENNKGKILGAMYIAYKSCRCISGTVWDDKGQEKSVAKSVASWIRRGDSVVLYFRFENDEQPQWKCDEHKDEGF